MRTAAVIIAVTLAITPVTHAGIFGEIDKFLHSVTESVTEKDKITGLRSLSLQDRKAQIKQADSAALSTIKKYGSNINERVSRSQYLRLKKIFERVHKVSHLRDEKWTVVLLPEKSFNAFVTGGTFVFANLGFMEFCNDDEAAAVIGHEIGHVTANHAFEMHSYLLAATLADAKNLKKEGCAALAGYDPLVLRANSGGPITPGMSFYVSFSDPNLLNYVPYIQNGQAKLNFKITDVRL
ncbi:MAG: M48 family metalloprotease [Candidatus Mycalebacterium zealandia]|nr:MAG: M48 family metalloprotease [Candidatus Mycalebacterium zealandia]